MGISLEFVVTVRGGGNEKELIKEKLVSCHFEISAKPTLRNVQIKSALLSWI